MHRKTANWFRIFLLKLRYPNIKILGRTSIDKNCSIICDDGADLVLDNVHISYGSMIRAAKNSSISITDTFIGRNCVIVATENIQIDSDCLIAEMVVIRDQDHNFDLSNNLVSQQGYSSSPILIKKNVWIGSKSSILKGVNIGSNSVIGAHSIINKEVPESSLAVGNPFKIIRNA